MSDLISMLGQVFIFINTQLMPIRIMNIPLFAWIISLILIAGVIGLLISFSPASINLTGTIKNKVNNKDE